ncbi:MAG: glycosyltransferase family 4 protein [Pseudomonadota bacterium]
MIKAQFAIPGELDTPTGGYGYARRVMEEIGALGIELEHLSLPGTYPLAATEEIREAALRLREVPSDVPLILDGLAGGALPAELLRELACPLIYLCHHPLADETGLNSYDGRRLQENERVALSVVKRVITTSHSTAAALASRFGVGHGKLRVAPPGTDPVNRSPGSGKLVPTVLSVGSFSPRKGHHHLIEALGRLSSEDWSLRLVGASSDPAYLLKIEQQIVDLGLQQRVALLGPMSSEDLAIEYENADIFALASVYEGFGMVFAEAVAHGLPALGHRIGAIAEATQGAAELVPIGELSRPLARAIKSAEARAQMADRSWEAAKRLFRWTDTARVIAQVIKEVAP